MLDLQQELIFQLIIILLLVTSINPVGLLDLGSQLIG